MKRPPREGEGRPTKYTKKLGKLICSRIALGESVAHLITDASMPASSTIYLWLLDEEKREFSDNYARARNAQAELMFEELLEIADRSDDVVSEGSEKKASAYAQNQKLRVETRKWYLSKVLPKKFGDKLDLTSGGDKLPQPIISLDVRDNRNAKDKETIG